MWFYSSPLLSYPLTYMHIPHQLCLTVFINCMSKIIDKKSFIIWVERLESQSFLIIPRRNLLNCRSSRWLWFRSIKLTCILFLKCYQSKTGRIPSSVNLPENQTLKTKPRGVNMSVSPKDRLQHSNKRYLEISYFLFPFSVYGNGTLLQAYILY